MPVIFSNPAFPLQVGPNGAQAYVQQLNFRQMINEVINRGDRSLDPMWAGRMLNNAYREIVQRRSWYALKIRGVINIPNAVNGGQASVVNGSNKVQGIGTPWTTALVGQQFRIGFTYPYQTIFAVDVANQILTVDTPFGGPTMTSGYQIFEAYLTMGNNFVRFDFALNQQQGWPMEVNVPVQTINQWDVWRTDIGWSTVIANRAPTPDGQMQVEIWPTPYQQQVFPFEGWIQPPDMTLDSDSPASFIRADVLVSKCLAEAKITDRTSKYYDPVGSKYHLDEYNRKLESMENADDALDLQSIQWEYGRENGRVGFGPGSTFAQSHDV